jgi:gas vesicle protein
MSSNTNNTTKIIGAILVGAAVGVVIGMLMAPDKGSETRKKLADDANDMAHGAEEEIKEVIDTIKKKVSEMEKTLSQGLDKAKEMVEEKAHQIKNNMT